MKKIILIIISLFTLCPIFAQSSNSGALKSPTFEGGAYIGYSLNQFINVGAKLTYNKFTLILDISGNKSNELGREEFIFSKAEYLDKFHYAVVDYNGLKILRLNTHIVNIGFAYNVTSHFYTGVILGCGLIGTTEIITGQSMENWANIDKTVRRRSYTLNDKAFNGGLIIGCKFNWVDLSIKFTNLEYLTFRIGFNIANHK